MVLFSVSKKLLCHDAIPLKKAGSKGLDVGNQKGRKDGGQLKMTGSTQDANTHVCNKLGRC